MRFTYAHSFWHIGISLGMYYLIQFFIFLHAHDVGNNPKFIERRGCEGVLFRIFPAVEFRKQRDILVHINNETTPEVESVTSV